MPTRVKTHRRRPGASNEAGSPVIIGAPRSWRVEAAAWARTILFVLAFLWLVAQPFVIPSASMEPTLRGGGFVRGDRILVNKFIFGPRIPFTNVRILHLNAPSRWDIVVFRSPDPADNGKVLVKRVAGLPGEEVGIYDGALYVNGERVEPPEPLRGFLTYTDRPRVDETDIARYFIELSYSPELPPILNPANDGVGVLEEDLRAFRERVHATPREGWTDDALAALARDLTESSRSIIRLTLELYYKPFAYGIRDEEQYLNVPPDSYYMLGDNSARSVDSRYYGWVHEGQILGRADGIIYPPSRWRDLSGATVTWLWVCVVVSWFVLAFSEVLPRYVVRFVPMHESLPAYGTRRGDRLVVNRLALRRLRESMVVAYAVKGSKSLQLGRVVSYDAEQECEITPLARDGSLLPAKRVPLKLLAGAVQSVRRCPLGLRRHRFNG